MVEAMTIEGFYSERSDRLGTRLCPLLSAYFFAKRYGTPFSFSWATTYDVEPPERVFQKSFVEKYLASHVPEHVDIPKTVHFNEGLCNPVVRIAPADLHAGRIVRFNHWLGVYAETNDEPHSNRAKCSQLFQEELLSSEIEKTFRILCGVFPKRFIGVHLRRGDLGSYLSRPKRFNQIFDRYCPMEACEVAARKYKLPVVLFSDSRHNLANGSGILQAHELLAGTAAASFTGMQRAILEMLLLGAADVLVGGKSGFSCCASVFGGKPVLHPIELIPAKDYVQILCHSHDAHFEGFSREQLIGAFDRGGQQLARAKQLEAAHSLLTVALKEMADPPQLLARMGHVAMARMFAVDAEGLFSRALEQERTPETLIGLIQSLSEQKKGYRARRLLKSACREFPDDSKMIRQAAKFLR